MPFGSGVHQLRVFTGSPGHVSTLPGPGSRPYPAGYRETGGGGAAHLVPRFPLPFGRRHSLLGHPVPAGRSAFLTVGPPALPGRIPSGFPRSAQLSCDRGGRPLYPGDGGVLPAGGSYPAGTRRFAAASPCIPLEHSAWRDPNVTRHHQGFTRVHPSGLPLACGPPDGSGTLGRLLRAPHPAVTSDARQSGDRPWTLAWDHTFGISRPPSGESTQLVRPRVALTPRCRAAAACSGTRGCSRTRRRAGGKP